MSDEITKHEFLPASPAINAGCYVCGLPATNFRHFTRDDGKKLVLDKVIDRYPRMLGLLKAAEGEVKHQFTWPCIDNPDCLRCQIQALLKEVEQ